MIVENEMFWNGWSAQLIEDHGQKSECGNPLIPSISMAFEAGGCPRGTIY